MKSGNAKLIENDLTLCNKSGPAKKIHIERIWAMPNKNTFEIKPIKELIHEEMFEGIWVDPFANKNKLATVTNDLNKEFDTDYNLDALDFLKMFDDNSVDGVLYDPPYSPRQVSECYNNVGFNITWDTTKASFWGNHKREISRIVRKGGKVITFGWNSGGIGMKYGFEINRILLVPHGGWHNDTICTVETKTQNYDNTGNPNKMEGNMPVQKLNNKDKCLIDALSKLPQNYWDFRNEDTREFTHGLHNYPAVMVSPISRNIIKHVKNIMPVNALLDPFAGSGTVLVEGMLAGISTVIGNDINPLALFLSKVKTNPLNIVAINKSINILVELLEHSYKIHQSTLNEIDSYMESHLKLDITAKDGWGKNAPLYLNDYCKQNGLGVDIPNFTNIGYWFRPKVVIELSLIKAAIQNETNQAIRDFIFVALSETIRLVSNRRNGEFKMFRMPVPKVKTHTPDVRKEFMKILVRNADKMNEFFNATETVLDKQTVKIFHDNACSLSSIEDDTIDLVITSPPYGDSRTTVAYGEFSRLTLQWLDFLGLTEKEIMSLDRLLMGGNKYRNGFEFNLDSKTLKESLEIIVDKDLERAGDVYSFYEDLNKSIAAVSSKTKKEGYHFWVVGNRTVKNEKLRTDMIISELAASHQLEHIHTIGRDIPNKSMPSLNSPTNITGSKSATMTNENIVVLRKI